MQAKKEQIGTIVKLDTQFQQMLDKLKRGSIPHSPRTSEMLNAVMPGVQGQGIRKDSDLTDMEDEIRRYKEGLKKNRVEDQFQEGWDQYTDEELLKLKGDDDDNQEDGPNAMSEYADEIRRLRQSGNEAADYDVESMTAHRRSEGASTRESIVFDEMRERPSRMSIANPGDFADVTVKLPVDASDFAIVAADLWSEEKTADARDADVSVSTSALTLNGTPAGIILNEDNLNADEPGSAAAEDAETALPGEEPEEGWLDVNGVAIAAPLASQEKEVVTVKSFLTEMKRNIELGIISPAREMDGETFEAQIEELFVRNPEYQATLEQSHMKKAALEIAPPIPLDPSAPQQRLIERRARMNLIFNKLHQDGLLVVRQSKQSLSVHDGLTGLTGLTGELQPVEHLSKASSVDLVPIYIGESFEFDKDDDEDDDNNDVEDNKAVRKRRRKDKKDIVEKRALEIHQRNLRNMDKLLEDIQKTDETQNLVKKKGVHLAPSVVDYTQWTEKSALFGRSMIDMGKPQTSRMSLMSKDVAKKKKQKLLEQYLTTRDENVSLQVSKRSCGMK